MQNKNGKLFIVATPIGNLADITLRALETLKNVDLILCEDTRVTNKLIKHYAINKPLIMYNDHSDQNARQNIINKLLNGDNLALVSDAGTPLISDPGYKLIQELKSMDIKIETIPGPCSIIAALTIAGIPTNRFTFIGFLPNKNNLKDRLFSEVRSLPTSLVCFESPNRLLDTLKLMKNYFNDRKIVVAREITKLFEEAIDGSIETVSQYYEINSDKLKGEIVMLIEPPKEESVSEQDITTLLNSLMKDMSLRDAVETTANQYINIPKKQIYRLALNLKH